MRATGFARRYCSIQHYGSERRVETAGADVLVRPSVVAIAVAAPAADRADFSSGLPSSVGIGCRLCISSQRNHGKALDGPPMPLMEGCLWFSWSFFLYQDSS